MSMPTDRPKMTLLPNVLFELFVEDCAAAGADDVGSSETVVVEVLGDTPESVAVAAVFVVPDIDAETVDVETVDVDDVKVKDGDVSSGSFSCQQSKVGRF